MKNINKRIFDFFYKSVDGDREKYRKYFYYARDSKIKPRIKEIVKDKTKSNEYLYKDCVVDCDVDVRESRISNGSLKFIVYVTIARPYWPTNSMDGGDPPIFKFEEKSSSLDEVIKSLELKLDELMKQYSHG